MGAGQESCERGLVETSANLSEGTDSVGGPLLPGRDQMAFGAPPLDEPLPVGAVGGRRVACRDQQEEESEAKAREPSILMLHRALLPAERLHTAPRQSGRLDLRQSAVT